MFSIIAPAVEELLRRKNCFKFQLCDQITLFLSIFNCKINARRATATRSQNFTAASQPNFSPI